MAHLQGQCCCHSLSSRYSLAATPLPALRQARLVTPRQPLLVENRVAIRFQRRGRKRIPSFRLVAMNSRDRRDGRPLQELGWYNPLTKETNLNAPAIKKWLQNGAQPSQTVGDLLRKAMILGEAGRWPVSAGAQADAPSGPDWSLPGFRDPKDGFHESTNNGIRLQNGWAAYAARSGLEMGDRLQLQRRGVIAKPGCVYLDARRAKGDAIRDSGMSTSEQLSEDTHPHRRPSTGKSSGITSAIGSCHSLGKGSPPAAPEGTWSASAAAVAPHIEQPSGGRSEKQKDGEFTEGSGPAAKNGVRSSETAGTPLPKASSRSKRVGWSPFHQPGEMDVMEQPGSSAGSEPLISIERKITCPTYCNRLHVTQTMALQLLPRVSEAQMKGDVSMQRCASGRNPGQQQYQALFKFKLRLTDELGNQWPVQYEGFVSSGQRHYRLTAGWTALIKHKKITVGDSIILERWTEDRTDLRLRVISGDGTQLKSSTSCAKSAPLPMRPSRASRRTKAAKAWAMGACPPRPAGPPRKARKRSASAAGLRNDESGYGSARQGRRRMSLSADSSELAGMEEGMGNPSEAVTYDAPAAHISSASITDGPHPPNTPAQPTRPALDAILAKRAVATLNIINSLGANDGRAGVVSSVGGILAQKFTGHPCPEAAG
ncbi:hypothetical protein WJX84_012148 [Apatococcus fuscideae]|uniref:30S ribosomal protein S16, chloroplastic n=1 Tax=Apatococcus fuscideae TaxID=2026836 RepID=A0AAW1SX52_9CHLO